MTVRVTLVSPAMTSALREARFEGEVSLDEQGLTAARAVAGTLSRAGRPLTGPSLRCRETADALGLAAEPVAALADWDVGRWRGRRLAEITGTEPEAVSAWLADPSAAPHGGESLTALCERVARWLASLPGGQVLAVVEPALIRVVVVHALALPPETFWRLDVPPLALTELTGRSERWNLRCGSPLTAG
ncbi:histidine phosphatase family protein [Streptomyces sp. NPDC004609]|uniref:histidine phosphatase family protein n=1 Tax=Streptomyces sp. NPDC004609 TaxID=3364704 RepID=UPI0036CD8978